MPRAVPSFLLVVFMATLLLGCRVSVGEPWTPPAPDYTFTADSFPPTARGQVFLPADQEVVIRVSSDNVGTGSRRLLVFEVEATPGTLLTVRSDTNQVLGASRYPEYWAASVSQASSVSPARVENSAKRSFSDRSIDRAGLVEPQSIGVEWTCVGPCVAIRPPAGSSRDYYLYVRSSTSQTVDLYAYRFEEQDENEPNDSTGTATFVPGDGFGQVVTVTGAIERLGDRDYFEIAQSGWGSQFVDVQLTAPGAAPEIGIYLEFLSDGFRLYPDDPPAIADVGELFVVRAEGGTRAGPATDSAYNVFLDPQ